MTRAGRWRAGTAALVAGLLLAWSPAQAAGDARRMVLATRDPALFAALSAFFSPRGVDVVQAPKPLQGTAEVVGAAPATADLVWLCDLGAGERALCVRPQGQSVIVRRLTVPAAALSPPDAAAVAMSVQVVLLREAPEPSPPPAPITLVATPIASVAPRPTIPALTLEMAAVVRSAPAGSGLRAGIDVAWAPALARRLALGTGLQVGGSVTERDIAWRLFARGQIDVSALRLQLEAGPTVHFRSHQGDVPMADAARQYAADVAAGLVVPFGRLFAGARMGASYLLSAPDGPGDQSQGRLRAQGTLLMGIGFL